MELKAALTGEKASPVTQSTQVTTPNTYETFYPTPPTKEQYKEELLRKRFNEADYRKKCIENRTAAIQEILKENITNSVRVENPQFLKAFQQGKSIGGGK